MSDTKTLTVKVLLLDQGDLRAANYALGHAIDIEKDQLTKSALKRVDSALWDITNWTGVEAIASAAIVGDPEYMKGKIS